MGRGQGRMETAIRNAGVRGQRGDGMMERPG